MKVKSPKLKIRKSCAVRDTDLTLNYLIGRFGFSIGLPNIECVSVDVIDVVEFTLICERERVVC